MCISQKLQPRWVLLASGGVLVTANAVVFVERRLDPQKASEVFLWVRCFGKNRDTWQEEPLNKIQDYTREIQTTDPRTQPTVVTLRFEKDRFGGTKETLPRNPLGFKNHECPPRPSPTSKVFACGSILLGLRKRSSFIVEFSFPKASCFDLPTKKFQTITSLTPSFRAFCCRRALPILSLGG